MPLRPPALALPRNHLPRRKVAKTMVESISLTSRLNTGAAAQLPAAAALRPRRRRRLQQLQPSPVIWGT